MQRFKKLVALALVSSLWSNLPRAQDASEEDEIDTRGLLLNEEGAFDGYTLIAPFSMEALLLLDMNGVDVHSWDAPGTECAIFLDDGAVLRWGLSPQSLASMANEGESDRRFQGPGVGGGLVEELDWEGRVRWRYVMDTETELLHHDIALLPNGNVLFLAWEYRTREEALAAGRDPDHVDERGMWPDVVYEVQRVLPEGGKIVWEWHAWDHLVQDFDEGQGNFGSVPNEAGKIDLNADHRGRPPLTLEEIEEREELARQMAALGYGGEANDDGDVPPRRGSAPDWLHTNAIDYLAAHDLIVLSSPAMNELWVIDHSTSRAEAAQSTGGRFGRGGELLWRWGHPRNYGAGDDGDQQLSFQHDPTWLPTDDPNELRLLVFNNGRTRPGDSASDESYSSADELILPFDAEHGFVRLGTEPFGPEGPAWRYSDPGTFFSSFISGAQRLPNGNTLICSGAQGRVFEVTIDGRVVWDFRNPFVGDVDLGGIPGNALYRAVRIAKDHPGLAGRGL